MKHLIAVAVLVAIGIGMVVMMSGRQRKPAPVPSADASSRVTGSKTSEDSSANAPQPLAPPPAIPVPAKPVGQMTPAERDAYLAQRREAIIARDSQRAAPASGPAPAIDTSGGLPKPPRPLASMTMEERAEALRALMAASSDIARARAAAGRAASTRPVVPEAETALRRFYMRIRSNDALAKSEARKLALLAPVEQAQDAAFVAAIRHPGPWKVLEPEITIEQEGGGRFWYSTRRATLSGEGCEREFLARIERMAHTGEPMLLRGGRIALIDRQGRYWVYGIRHKDFLRCYDGKNWTEVRTAAGETTDGDGALAADTPVGTWTDIAFADSAGNLHFVSTSGSSNEARVHTRHADGTWTMFQAKGEKANDLISRARFIEQAGGRVALVNLRRGHEQRMLYFDSEQWSVLKFDGCPDPRDELDGATALPDGSIVTVCDHRIGWAYWPQGVPNSPVTRIPELIQQLEDPGVDKREAATGALMDIGAPASDADSESPPR